MIRRSGITLTEVLVAIFVMAIGLMALLTLFPLGALNMKQAIKDDRTAMACQNADALLRSQWADYLENPNPAALTGESFSQAMESPDPAGVNPPRRTGSVPSYPVFIDPVGWKAYGAVTFSTTWQPWVGGQAGSVPRRTLSILNTPSNQLTRRWTTLLDDIQFDENGTPGTTLERDIRYTWAYMLRRPFVSDPRVVEMSVVVYSGRAVTLNSPLPGGEFVYANANFDANTRQITFSYTGDKPPIRKGGFVLDGTMPAAVAANNPPGGFFYRVVNVSEVVAGTIVLDVQTPIRVPVTGTATRTLIILEDVAEVFDRGTLR